MRLSESEVLEVLREGDETAYSLLWAADPNFERRFNRLNTTMVKLLADVRVYFPDVQYYTASGGFNLMVGPSHDNKCRNPQQELVALAGRASVGDGDF